MKFKVKLPIGFLILYSLVIVFITMISIWVVLVFNNWFYFLLLLNIYPIFRILCLFLGYYEFKDNYLKIVEVYFGRIYYNSIARVDIKDNKIIIYHHDGVSVLSVKDIDGFMKVL